MAKIAACVFDYTLNSVALEASLKSAELKFEQENIDVSGFQATGRPQVVGNYGWSQSLQGNWDGASGSVDATIFGMVGSAGVTANFDPTGAEAGSNDPNYDGTVVLKSYSISCKLGAAVEFSADLTGSGALTRAVA